MAPITSDEAAEIERAIAALEARTGVQVVAAVVPRADAYPELAWRAFALGAALAAMVALAVDLGRLDWMSAGALLIQALVILGAGGAAALATVSLPRFARWFLREGRARAEVRQCAESMFLSRELFATARRDAVLVLVAMFEHRVVIVPDAGYRGRVEAREWEAVVERMTPELRAHRVAQAFAAGLAELERLLVARGFTAAARDNTLPDALVRGEAP